MLRRLGRIAMGTMAVIVVVLVCAWCMVGYASTKGIEKPKYEVLSKADGYEIREYAAYIRAEVTLPGKYRETLDGGFRQVADYIFGNNTKREDIPMTAPVLSEKSAAKESEKIPMTAPVLHERSTEGESFTIAFIMPSKYTMETLPQPNNPDVRLREVPKQRFAVVKFSWYATKDRVERKTERLKAAMERDGLKPAGEPIVAQYNPPWTPPFMRRNEIQIPIQ